MHNLLYSRCVRAPKLIVYDNACNCHLFMMYREPFFYRDSRFCLDRLHENCHGSCSPTYAPDTQINLRNKNSQMAEQKNSTFVPKRAQFYAMGHFMFLFHLRYYIWRREELHALTKSEHSAAKAWHASQRFLYLYGV